MAKYREHTTLLNTIKRIMRQKGITQRGLVPLIGSPSLVSQMLSGKREITMPMARALHKHLGIPAEVLLQEPGTDIQESGEDANWTRFPFKAMAKFKWISRVPKSEEQAKAVMEDLIRRAGKAETASSDLFRKNDQTRINAKMNPYALQAWCWQVMATANEMQLAAEYAHGTVTMDFLGQIAQLSWFEDGPRRTKALLEDRGIPLIILPHLPRTYLDGAVLKLDDGRPVIGLTLRYDRIDNFWFCLLHELAHVGLHLEGGESDAFIDDLNLRNEAEDDDQNLETQADAWAEEALIPHEIWKEHDVRAYPTALGIINLANTLHIHPAIVAGRIRFEQKNYRLFTQFVGTGQIRSQFDATDS